MPNINIQLPDGENKSYPKGTTVGEIMESIGAQNSAVGAKVNGNLADFYYELESDSDVEPIKVNTEEGLYFIRHTAAHIMAEAVQSLFPDAKVTIGPVIENGFYYDFEYSRGFTPEDLAAIEKKMKEIAGQKKPLTRKKVSREEAIQIFESDGENYKVEIVNDLPVITALTILQSLESVTLSAIAFVG